MNGGAVITNEDKKIKTGRDYPKCNAKFALLDPVYTYSVPKFQMVSGAFDILSHIMETYFSAPDESNVSDDISEALMRNAMNAAWGGIVGYDEIIVDLSSHKTTDNILLHKAFSVSVGDLEHLKACDYVGLVSAKKEPDKMAKAGFTTTESKFVHAPIINELPMTLECELVQVIDGGKYLGKIKNVSADEQILGEDGQIDLGKFVPITYDGVHRGYYRLGEKVGNAFCDGAELK